MTLRIHLLGTVSIDVDGTATTTVGGRKPWAVLAYLLLMKRPPSRSHLAELLFSQADDPLRALRWSLNRLRGALGRGATLGGNPVRLALPPGTLVDTDVVQAGTWVEAAELPSLAGSLLEGMDFPDSPAFEAWLTNERRHLQLATAGLLRDATLARLGAGDATAAVDLAARLVGLDPLDVDGQALLVRSYVLSGDPASARRQVADCESLLAAELGIEPGPELYAALEATPGLSTAAPVHGDAAVRALIQAGRAAIDAGAVDAGVDCLRRAAVGASDTRDELLRSDTLLAVGSALVHAGRGLHHEGAVALHEVLRIADARGDGDLGASACADLAWVELVIGQYVRIEHWLGRAAAYNPTDPRLLAAIHRFRGWGLTEVGDYTTAIHELEQSVTISRRADAPTSTFMALSMLGRAHLLRRELPTARDRLEEALEIGRQTGALNVVPDGFLAEVELLEGNVDVATSLFERVYATARHIADACVEAEASRGLGLVAARAGDLDTAVARLHDGRMFPIWRDDHLWTSGWALDALCSIAVAYKHPSARRWVHDLESLAARTGMRELLARSYLHRHRLGDDTARETVDNLVRDVDNPHLHALAAEPETDLELSLTA